MLLSLWLRVMASSDKTSANKRPLSALPSPRSASYAAFSVSYCGRRNLSGLGTLVMELVDESVEFGRVC